MKLPSFAHLLNAAQAAFSRFPLVVLVAIIGTVNIMTMIAAEHTDDLTISLRLMLTCFLGLPLLITTKVIAENQGFKGFLKWLPSLGGIALLALYFFTLQITESQEHYIDLFRFFGLNFALHLMVAFAAYMDKSSVADFWEYNKLLFVNFLVGAFYSLIIFGGLSAAILAVDQLFHLDINEKTYGHLFVLIGGLFNTTYFLYHFPKKYDGLISEAVDTQNTKVISNLTKFILIPLVGIYFLILYSYSFKILIEWELPEGWVSSLTIGFSVVGIFTYLLNYMLTRFVENNLIQRYRNNFFYVLLPLVVLLFVAIGRRVSDYGITEERYVVMALGFWLLFLSLYFIISKTDNIKVIPISLAVFTLLTVLSPFSAFQVSKKSQLKRFLAFANTHGMMQEGKLIPLQQKLSYEDYLNGSSIISFFADRNWLDELQPYVEQPIEDLYKEKENPTRYQKSLALSDYLKIASDELPPAQKNDYFHYGFNQWFSTTIEGYEIFQPIRSHYSYDEKTNGLIFNVESRQLEWKEGDNVIEIYNLQPIIENLRENYDQRQTYEKAPPAFELKGQLYDVKIAIESIGGKREGEVFEVEYLNGWGFIKKK